MGSGRKKSKPQKQWQALKKTSDEFFARTGKMNYAVARARDVGVAWCPEEAAARQSTEILVQEQKLSTDTEEHLRLDTE